MRAFVLVVILALATSFASAQGGPRISGTLSLSGVPQVVLNVTYSCVGQPTCTGTYTAVFKDQPCVNSVTYGGAFTLTGVSLSSAGSFSGTLVLANDVSSSDAHGSNICTYDTSGPATSSPYTATVTGNGSGEVRLAGTSDSGFPYTFAGGYTATGVDPPFPLTVTSNITDATANAAAQVQFRPQDVGSAGQVYVFALAPRSLAHAALLAKDDGDCVLAQVNGAGQLVGVSASTMQPALAGVLSAQGASVTILNNVATPAVAGAQFFVGYGSDAATMLSTGLSQNALGVPGSTTCAPSLVKSAGALSGLWWNPGESGWGIDFTQRGNNVFAAWYTYDGSGNPKWYVSVCAMGPASTATSGTCNGALLQVTGPRFFGAAFNANSIASSSVGTLQVAFADAGRGSMTYTLGTQSRTVALERQPFPTGTTQPLIDHTDLWWNPDESGWGVALTQQFQIIFAAWYVYNDGGQPVWYVVPNCPVNSAGNRCSGAVYRTTGPAFGPTFNPNTVASFEVGTATFAFSDANSGTLSYTVNGVSGNKAITRQIF
jgi:hypothetical protein